MEEETWKKAREKMPEKFKWDCIPATKECVKGRAKGGIVMAVSKEMKGAKIKEMNKGAMELCVTYNNNKWRIITVYSQNIEEMLDSLMEEIEEEKEGYLMIGGDYNARTGNEGGPIVTDKKKGKEIRRSRDKVMNREGRIMVNKLKERGWMILNGSFDKEGEWTYIGEQGLSVIDYVVTNDKAIEEVKKVKEGNRIESDHAPLEVELEGAIKKKTKRKEQMEVERSVWTQEGIEQYHEKCEGWSCTKESSEEMWTEIKKKVENSITKVKKKLIPWKLGRKEWHNKEWKEKKRELRRELRKLKKDKIQREEYVEKRKKYRKWCDSERRKHEMEEEEKIRLIRTEEEAWKYINKYRK